MVISKCKGGPFLWRRQRFLAGMVAASSLPFGLSVEFAFAGEATPQLSTMSQPVSEQVVGKTALAASQGGNEELVRKLETMEKRMQMLEMQLKEKDQPQKPQAPGTASQSTARGSKKDTGYGPWWTETAAPSQVAPLTAVPAPTSTSVASASSGGKTILDMVDSPVAGLSIGAYGELKYGFQQNPADRGHWQNGFDAARVVLLPTYQITPNIIFNAEIEFEHSGIAFDNDDKLHGTAEIEQVWVDFKIVDYFNVRSPGVDLVPFGYINEHHEPTQFYSVNRPELYNGLIPSTWKAPATSVYGTITDGLKYQLQASSSLEDYGDSFDKRTDANRLDPINSAGYSAGFTGQDALGLSRPVTGNFQQLNNTIAAAGKLDYSPTFLPGFSGSTSVYFSPNTTPRGAFVEASGAPLGDSSLTMIDSEFRYRIPETGLEFRAEGVFVSFGNPRNLRANNDEDPTNNVGKSMYGASGEVAYHFPLGTLLNSEWEAVPFYRYTYENFQTSGFAGTDANLPNGSGQQQFHTAGFAVFPSPKVVLKGTYQKALSSEAGGPNSDSVLGAVGFFF